MSDQPIKRPDFSAEMLGGFLKLRIAMTVRLGFPAPPKDAEIGAKAELRLKADVSPGDFSLALRGKLNDPVARARIWAAHWVDPSEFGIRLTDDGGQEGGDVC